MDREAREVAIFKVSRTNEQKLKKEIQVIVNKIQKI